MDEPIEHLTLVEAIRRRPGMYIGDVDPHPLLWELVANSLDLELAGRAVHVEVEIHTDGSISVQDDGPGLQLPLEALLCEGHTTPTADGHAPHVHLNLLRVYGLQVVGALSERVEIRTRRGEAMTRQLFSPGTAISELEREADPPSFGTRVRFWPDPLIFGRFEWDPTAIQRRLHELVALRARLSCRFVAAPLSFAATLDSSDLLPQCVGRPALHEGAIQCRAVEGKVTAQIALRWHRRERWSKPSVRSFCNLRETTEGMHVTGLRRGIGKAIARATARFTGREWARAFEAVEANLAALVAVDIIDPTYPNPLRDNPTNPELAGVVEAAILDVLPNWFEEHPDVLEKIVKK